MTPPPPPKFRGDDDDWLDDENERGGGKGKVGAGLKKRAIEARNLELPWEEANATISEVYPKLCQVRFDEDGGRVLCAYRRAAVVSKGTEGLRERSPVAVGDRVRAHRTSPDAGVIDGICARRSVFMRPAPGKAVGEAKIVHVLAANVEVLLLVASAHRPDFPPGLVDRYSIAAQRGGIELWLGVSKCDLVAAGEARPWELYRDLGFRVFELNSKGGDGISALREKLVGRSVLFSGQSGVGKTSLLNALLGQTVGRVGEVNAFTGKGKHTTTSSVLIEGPKGSRWFDTPGVRELGLVGVDPEDVREYFAEFASLPCHNRGCLHAGESACDAVTMPRYESYRRIVESLRG